MGDKQGYGTDLENYINKKISIRLKGDRKIAGKLKGADKFMNLLLTDCNEISNTEEIVKMGTTMIRGNSIVMWECIDKVS